MDIIFVPKWTEQGYRYMNLFVYRHIIILLYKY